MPRAVGSVRANGEAGDPWLAPGAGEGVGLGQGEQDVAAGDEDAWRRVPRDCGKLLDEVVHRGHQPLPGRRETRPRLPTHALGRRPLAVAARVDYEDAQLRQRIHPKIGVPAAAIATGGGKPGRPMHERADGSLLGATDRAESSEATARTALNVAPPLPILWTVWRKIQPGVST